MPIRDTESSNIRWFEVFDIRWPNIESSNLGSIFGHRIDSVIRYSINRISERFAKIRYSVIQWFGTANICRFAHDSMIWWFDIRIRAPNHRISPNIFEYLVCPVTIIYIIYINNKMLNNTAHCSTFSLNFQSEYLIRTQQIFGNVRIFEYIRWFGVCTSNLRIIESSNHRITEYLKLHRITEYRILANLTDIRSIEYRLTEYRIIEYIRWTESPNIRSIESSNHRISNRHSNIYRIVRYP